MENNNERRTRQAIPGWRYYLGHHRGICDVGFQLVGTVMSNDRENVNLAPNGLGLPVHTHTGASVFNHLPNTGL